MFSIAAIFYRQSIGVFIAFYVVMIVLVIGPSSTYDLVLPFVLLKGIQYPGLIYYYKLLRPDKLVFFMNLGRSIGHLWLICFLTDLLLSVFILLFN